MRTTIAVGALSVFGLSLDIFGRSSRRVAPLSRASVAQDHHSGSLALQSRCSLLQRYVLRPAGRGRPAKARIDGQCKMFARQRSYHLSPRRCGGQVFAGVGTAGGDSWRLLAKVGRGCRLGSQSRGRGYARRPGRMHHTSLERLL